MKSEFAYTALWAFWFVWPLQQFLLCLHVKRRVFLFTISPEYLGFSNQVSSVNVSSFSLPLATAALLTFMQVWLFTRSFLWAESSAGFSNAFRTSSTNQLFHHSESQCKSSLHQVNMFFEESFLESRSGRKRDRRGCCS